MDGHPDEQRHAERHEQRQPPAARRGGGSRGRRRRRVVGVGAERVGRELPERVHGLFERRSHRRRVGVAVVPVLLQRPHADLVERVGHVQVRSASARRDDLFREVLGDRPERRGAAEGRLAHEEVMEQAADGVEVRAPVERLPARLLRRHVLGRPADEPGHRERRPLVLDELGDAEVADLHVLAPLVVLHDHDVLRLQVPVNHAVVVRLLEREQHLPDEVPDAPRGEGGLLVDDLEQVGPVEELHRDVERRAVVLLAVVEDLHGVRVREAARRAGLAMEAPLDLRVGRHVRVKHLQGDLSVEVGLRRRVDRAHRADADDGGDLVLARDRLADERIDLFFTVLARQVGVAARADGCVGEVSGAAGRTLQGTTPYATGGAGARADGREIV